MVKSTQKFRFDPCRGFVATLTRIPRFLVFRGGTDLIFFFNCLPSFLQVGHVSSLVRISPIVHGQKINLFHLHACGSLLNLRKPVNVTGIRFLRLISFALDSLLLFVAACVNLGTVGT